jgi:hypothetical protein
VAEPSSPEVPGARRGKGLQSSTAGPSLGTPPWESAVPTTTTKTSQTSDITRLLLPEREEVHCTPL